MTIKIKLLEDGAHCWVGDDEADAFVVVGRADTVEAVARILRSAAAEHEFAQRGAKREPFVDDMTAVEAAEAAKAKAAAEAAAKLDALRREAEEKQAIYNAAATKLAEMATALVK